MPGLSGFRFPIYTPTNATKANQAAVPADGDFTLIGGVQEKGLELSAPEIDITNQSSNENREILGGHGIKSNNVNFSGILQNSDLYKALETNFLNQKLRWFRIIQTDNANRKYTSLYKITALSFNGSHDGAITFSCSLSSSGELTIS